MAWQDTQQVCLNGHQITDCYKFAPLSRKDFCTDCGAKTVFECPTCSKEIPGATHFDGVIDLSGRTEPVPKVCQYCGSKFPWAGARKKSKKEKDDTGIPTFRWSISRTKKIIWGILSLIGLLLAIVTQGFQAWDFFKPKNEKKLQPILNIGAQPIKINYREYALSEKDFTLTFKVETGNGVYKFIDSIKVDTFKIIDSSYFVLDYSHPKMDILKSSFEKMILGETIKEQNIGLELKADFILKGDKTMELYLLKSEKLIARITLQFPFYFEGNKLYQQVEVPVYTYYKAN